MNTGNLTILDIRQSFFAGLKELYDTDEINGIIYILFEEFLGWPRTKLHLEPGAVITGAECERFSAALFRLANGCPVQYITGNARFNELQIIVNPSVLIPRPETAELAMLIEEKLKTIDLKGFSAIDIGTGSGCIAVYLKKHFPTISMYGTDVSEDALSMARYNAARFGTIIDFYLSDILLAHDSLTKFKFNLIVSNPPYVTIKEKQAMKRNVTEYEPQAALFVPDEDPLLYYREIARYAKTCLVSGGLIYLEINEAFGGELTRLLYSAGFSEVLVLKDFRGRDRFIRAEFRTRS